MKWADGVLGDTKNEHIIRLAELLKRQPNEVLVAVMHNLLVIPNSPLMVAWWEQSSVELDAAARHNQARKDNLSDVEYTKLWKMDIQEILGHCPTLWSGF